MLGGHGDRALGVTRLKAKKLSEAGTTVDIGTEAGLGTTGG